MAESTYDKFRKLLAELFMFDRADLDFGIYRIMNAKRDEVTRFLDDDLLPQVKTALLEVDQGQRAQLQAELKEAENAAALAGFDPDDSPKVQDLRKALAATGDPVALEAEVFSHLYSFFRRYYKDGDFISLRRYKEGVYAIPYEGEEVKLYWANHDQYYIKSGEYFRDYAFRLADGRRVHFKLVQADEERDNTKAPAGQERRFILSESEPIREELGSEGAAELIIPFEYRPDPQKRKREELVAEAARKVLADEAAAAWFMGLAAAPTDKNPKRTLLEKHLNEYTARNTFDYFIHKDLGGFLRRELDFYIKNEVMHLDDIESEGRERVEQYLAKIKAIRRIAHKIIDFLAQLENFQKKLWLKKKFVVETNWCVTLDRVPEDFYPEIAANEAQREEWVRLFAIDEIAGDLTQPGYSEPLTAEFLKGNQSLVLDTAHFDAGFKDRLLATFDDVDGQTAGLLIHSENFQGLTLCRERMRGQVGCTYIDPPYNSKTTEIAYKNDYKHSSWLALMADRLRSSRVLSTRTGSHVVAIDENEQEVLGRLLSEVFTDHKRVCTVVIHNKKGIQGDYFSYNHDYAFFCIPRALASTNARLVPEADWEYDNLRKWGRESERETARNCFYPVLVRDAAIVGFGDVCDGDFHPPSANIEAGDTIAVYPVDPQGIERKWRYARNTVEGILPLLKVNVVSSTGEIQILKAKAEKPVKTVWDDPRYIAGDYGTKWLTDLGLKIREDLYPKSLHTVADSILALSDNGATVCDYFAGSGTTGHAVIKLNRDDGGTRSFVLLEMGEHFDSVLLPRTKKVTYSPKWKDGKPKRRATDEERERGPHLVKYLRLESYEDALNNLDMRRDQNQDQLLVEHADLREDYTLRYMLDVESSGSASLLNLDQFEDPFSYILQVGRGSVGETRPVAVDLVETFNYLLGLRVKHVDSIRGFKAVEGASPQGERVLVIWRNTREKSNPDLDEFFQKQGYNTRDAEFDLVYVNGDNNLENLRRPDETWKVRLIEEDFKRLMFDVEDV